MIDSADGGRRATILRALRECLEVAEIDRRMEPLEERLGLRSGQVVPFVRRAS
jgi:hypothetical protein